MRTIALVVALVFPFAYASADDDVDADSEEEEEEADEEEEEPAPKPKKKKRKKKPVDVDVDVAPAAEPAAEIRASTDDGQPRRLALAGELLGAAPVDEGNRDLFAAGGGAGLGFDVYLSPVFGLHAGAAFFALRAGDGMSSTTWLAGHAGPRVHLGTLVFGERTHNDLWIDVQMSYGTSGGIRRPGFDTGAAMLWEVSPAVRLGPVVRYHFGIDPRDSHAQVVTVGLAFGVGRRSRVATVAPVLDRDGDGVADAGDECPDEHAGAKPHASRAGCPTDDQDDDGLVDAKDQCPLEPVGDRADPSREGCPFTDKDRDEIADLYDKCPDEPGPPNTFEPSKHGCGELARVVEGKIEILQQVFFETDSAAIKEESSPVLKAVAKILAGLPDVRVRIEGHTDEVGTDAHNLDLSKRRARAVATWLIQNGGIDPSRLETEGYGKTRPIVQSSSGDAALNRRVEFVLLEK